MENQVAEWVGENVRRLRVERGWTQDQLARAVTDAGCPMALNTVSKVELGQRGERGVSVDELAALAEVLEVPPASLLRDPALLAADELVPLLEEYQRREENHRTIVKGHQVVQKRLRRQIDALLAAHPEAERAALRIVKERKVKR